MTSYVYDKNTNQLTYMLDAENFYTRYEYEAGTGRLLRTYKQTEKGEQLISEHSYNYGRDQ